MALTNQQSVLKTATPEAGFVTRASLTGQSRTPQKTVRPFTDDTNKDINGKEREGYSAAYAKTFGAESFNAGDNDAQSYFGDMTSTDPTTSGLSSPYEDYEGERDVAYLQSSLQYQEIAMGGDGNLYTPDVYTPTYYYADSYYEFQNYASAPQYDAYSGFDTTDPQVTSYLGGSKLMLDTAGAITGIDDGISCLRADVKGGRAEAIMTALTQGGPRDLTAKTDLVKNATIDAEGNLLMGEQCMDPNSAAGKQIILAKAQLDAGQDPTALAQAKPASATVDPLAQALPLTAKLDAAVVPQGQDAVFIATAPKAEQDPKFQTFMAKTTEPSGVSSSAQGNDLFMATQAMQGNKFSVLAKPTELSASTADVAPAVPTADTQAPKQPAPSPAFSV